MKDINSILQRLRISGAYLPLFDWDEPPSFSPGLNADDSYRLPKTAPEDLRIFLSLCGEISAADIHNGYFIGGEATLNPSVWSALPSKHDSIPLLPIGSDGGGNAFLIKLSDPHLVYKWNHESGELQQVAESFSDFLERIATDWEHYIDDDHDYVYISG